MKAVLIGTREMHLITAAADLRKERKIAPGGGGMQIFNGCYSSPPLLIFLWGRVINPFRYVSNCTAHTNNYSENINILHAGCGERGKKKGIRATLQRTKSALFRADA